MASTVINTREDLDATTGTPEHDAFMALLAGTLWRLEKDDTAQAWVAIEDNSTIERFNFTRADFPDAQPPALPEYVPEPPQAGQARLHEIEQAIQNHINQTVAGLGMGFTDDQSLIGKYAGYDNVFRPIAEAVGKWVAEIWYLAAQDKVAIVSGKKSIPTVDEALAQIPPFVMPEQQKVGE